MLIDGKASVSCQISLEKVAGKSVTTLEGFDAAERERFAAAFAATGALQCGFCTPGILVRVKALIDKKGSDLTRDDAARYLGAHLCRCTGYSKILDAVEVLAAGRVAGGRSLPRAASGSRGTSTRASSSPSATATTSTTSGFPACCTAPCGSPTTPGPTCVRIDTAAARGAAGRGGRVHRRRRPR